MTSKFSPEKISLIYPLILTLSVVFLVNVNFFRKTDYFSGSVKDAADGGPIDLAEIKVENQVTYSNRTGQYFISQESLPLIGFAPSSGENMAKVSVLPPYQYEVNKENPVCRLTKVNWLKRNIICPVVFYPQAFEVASRVMSTVAVGGLEKEDRVRARKSRLWDLISPESQKFWTNREEMAGFLTLEETIQVMLKQQIVSFTVSRQPIFRDSHNYLGKTLSGSQIAQVEVQTVDVLGKSSQSSLFFLKTDGLWRYLMEETPQSVSDFTTRNGWVLKGKTS